MSLGRSIKDTIGIEIETNNLTQRHAIDIVQNNDLLYGWKVHHDASIDNIRYTLADSRFKFSVADYAGRLLNRTTFGAEIVSPPLDTVEIDNWEDQLKFLLSEISKFNENPAKSTSIHIHVNCSGFPIFAVQNLIRLWSGLEASIYRLSCAEMGFHRGPLNKDYLYCRPLNKPQCVISDRCYRHSYSIDKMLQAKNFKEFFTAYGNVALNRESNKYHPARYSALNFYSLQSIGTIEFRTFNFTSDYKNIIAWIRLCQSMIQQSMGKPFELSPQFLGYNGDFNVPMLQAILEFDDKTAIQLEKLWYQADWQKSPEAELFTHSTYNEIIWDRSENKFVPDKIEKVRRYNGDNYRDLSFNQRDSEIPSTNTIRETSNAFREIGNISEGLSERIRLLYANYTPPTNILMNPASNENPFLTLENPTDDFTEDNSNEDDDEGDEDIENYDDEGDDN